MATAAWAAPVMGSFCLRWPRSSSDQACTRAAGVGRVIVAGMPSTTEGAWPQSRRRIAELFAGVPEDETRRILGENALQVYAFDADGLRAVADRVGIAPTDIAETPVAWEQPHKLAYVNGVTSIAR